LARPPWGPAYGARCGYGSSYMTAHGHILRRRISHYPNQGYDWLTQLPLVATRHRRVRSATRAAARRGCACDFLSSDMLRNEGAGTSTRRVAFGSGCSRCQRRCACPHRVRSVFGLSRSFRCDRGKSRRCKRSARYSPSDILGRAGDGSNRRYRKIFRHGCLKIGSAEEIQNIGPELT
jgi:hypothetical protein